jgi:hypothetical protein
MRADDPAWLKTGLQNPGKQLQQKISFGANGDGDGAKAFSSFSGGERGAVSGGRRGLRIDLVLEQLVQVVLRQEHILGGRQFEESRQKQGKARGRVWIYGLCVLLLYVRLQYLMETHDWVSLMRRGDAIGVDQAFAALAYTRQAHPAWWLQFLGQEAGAHRLPRPLVIAYWEGALAATAVPFQRREPSTSRPARSTTFRCHRRGAAGLR